MIAFAALFGAIFKLGQTGLRIWTETAETAARIFASREGGSIAYFGSNLSPALISVGYIVGINIAVLVFLGGALNWLVAIPIYAANHPWPMENGAPMAALDYANDIWSNYTRYLGVGAMVVGGLWALISLRKAVAAGVRAGLDAYRSSTDGAVKLERTERDVPVKWVFIALLISIVPLYAYYLIVVKGVAISLFMAVMMLLAAALFSAVAGYMALPRPGW